MIFISISEVVDSIAGCVSIPEEWKTEESVNTGRPIPRILNAAAGASTKSMKFQLGLFNGLFNVAFRFSTAAGALECFLQEAAEQAPKLRDRGRTGWPKLMSEATRDEIMGTLVHMAKWSDRYETARQNGRYEEWPGHTTVDNNEGKFKNLEDAERFQNVDFERTELVQFLDKYEIPHSLGSEPSRDIAQQGTNEHGVQPSAIFPPELDMSERGGDQANEPMKSPNAVKVTRHRQKTRKDMLDAPIEKAKEKAIDREDYHSVWAALMHMAKTPDLYPPLLGHADDELKWGVADEINFFSKENLRKRMDPNAR